MSDTSRHRLEHQLAELHLREHAVLLGNGTTGLALLMRALGLQDRQVAVPDSVCLNVPLGLRLGGAVPEYLDNQWSDLGLAVAALAVPDPARGALLAVHGYGQVSDMDPLIAAAHRQGLPLLEDACLAMGGTHHGRPVGSFGLASVISFGAGKPLSLDHGGAVLTDDAALAAELRALDAALPAFREAAQARIDALGSAHTRLYNRCWPDEIASEAPAYAAELLASGDAFLHRFDPRREAPLQALLPRLPALVQQRREQFERLRQLLRPLEGEALQVLPLTPGAVPWRLNVLMPHRHEALQALHAQGLHASSWHPRASAFLPGPGAEAAHPVAERLGQEILNLWVDEHATPAYFQDVVRTLAEHLSSRVRHDLTLPA
ncbi:DegT/DnrJ/EryC1/StrS family aminotransferase [Pelomonas sp. APW6]|uniref:DegT/DnrJ/EryC1/StrS family aminotransferase n=1 Tax=Roseateles subflavus TaxID=3053353 RepID=A0ABT7LM85_9BURK|nr:DegT/DnrJ/EryC1/StrS family aminotransferase [Pelomonas sp. APW6]MDL5033265.1 DegT/DnrJ/EryC1/StrS family aminotransferase [Pelomonas sp. APW6]